MQQTYANQYQINENKNTAKQLKLLNGILGKEKVTYSEMKLGLQEYRPHYTNSKYNSNFSSNFNKKFVKRYEHLSYLKKAASYNSKFIIRTLLINVALILIVKVSEQMDLFSLELTTLYNLFVFALLGYLMYKATTVTKSIKALNKANITTTGGISVIYLFIAIANLLFVFPLTEFSNLHPFNVIAIVPFILSIFLLMATNKKIKYVMPVISNAERKEEKAHATIRYNKSLKLMSEQPIFEEFKKHSKYVQNDNGKVVYLNQHTLKDKEMTKYLKRRKGR